jgi:thiamine pyrophosphate-dependent acetolactate synthase large subunit-like protein
MRRDVRERDSVPRGQRFATGRQRDAAAEGESAAGRQVDRPRYLTGQRTARDARGGVGGQGLLARCRCRRLRTSMRWRRASPLVLVGSAMAGDAAQLAALARFAESYALPVAATAVGGMGASVPMAVAAALRHRVAPVIIVAGNRTYRSIGMHHASRYAGRPAAAAADLVNPDFAACTRAFGADGFTIRAEAEIAAVLDAALAARGVPAVLHVHASAMQVAAWRRTGAPDF